MNTRGRSQWDSRMFLDQRAERKRVLQCHPARFCHFTGDRAGIIKSRVTDDSNELVLELPGKASQEKWLKSLALESYRPGFKFQDVWPCTINLNLLVHNIFTIKMEMITPILLDY